MRLTMPLTILSAAAALVLVWHADTTFAQPILATGPDEDVTAEGLHRVHPSLMEAAWVKPDLDLSTYTRILIVPTAVQFRDVPRGPTNARSRIATELFPVNEERKQWLRSQWQRAIEEKFAQQESYEVFDSVESNVLVVQGLLADVICRIPPDTLGSSYNLVRDPWSASVILELRDAVSGELLARTIDRRNGRGLLEVGEAWYRTEDLLDRWAAVLSDRLYQLSRVADPQRHLRPSETQ